jgi:hypothetical protein
MAVCVGVGVCGVCISGACDLYISGACGLGIWVNYSVQYTPSIALCVCPLSSVINPVHTLYRLSGALSPIFLHPPKGSAASIK